MKQNQIGTQLFRIKQMIQAQDLDKGEQQDFDIKQDNENELYQGIELLNQQKWQEANEIITQQIKLSKKQQSLGTLFKSICLIEMNQPGQGIILREQAKRINNNLYIRILDQELRKNPQNTIILIAKSYALNQENQFQEAIEQCEKILRQDPQHLHALYRKSYYLSSLDQYSQAMQCIDVALKCNQQYSIGYFWEGVQRNYKDEIDCYNKAIGLDPNFALALHNKGDALMNLKQYNDAVVCFHKTIQLDPECAAGYKKKGDALKKMKNYSLALKNYKQATSYWQYPVFYGQMWKLKNKI